MRRRKLPAASLTALLVACGLGACDASIDVFRPLPSAIAPDAAPLDAGAPDARRPDASGPATTPDAAPLDASPPDVAPPGPAEVTDVTSSNAQTCAVVGGSVYCWGTSPGGQNTPRPQRLSAGSDGAFHDLTGGAISRCARTREGAVECWGGNDDGELATSDVLPRDTPTTVTLPGPVARVRGRFRTFCARLYDGNLYCWGENSEGQLGQDDPFPNPGTDGLSPVRIAVGSDFTDSDSGDGHTCALRAPGALYCWGRNSGYELGLGSGAAGQLRVPTQVGLDRDWIAISTGQDFTCGLRAPGRLYCFGQNGSGELGLGDRNARSTPAAVGDGDDWTSIDIDTFHGCGLRRPGTLWCWGRNVEGQLGLGDNDDRDTPTRVGGESDWVQVSVGRFHTCARRAGGGLYCAGENTNGRLGTGDFDRRNVLTRVVPE